MNNVIRFGENFIEMEFQPDWSKVKSLWDFLKSVIQLILYDSNKSDLISMGGVELVENAVKYVLNNDVEEKKVVFRLDFIHEQNKVMIRVTNSAKIEDINSIKASVTKLMSETNKRKMYLEKLLEDSKNDIEEETMELGIMRVIVEANANVKIETPKSGVLNTTAIFNVIRKL